MRNQMPKLYALILTLLLITIVTGCGEVFRTEVKKNPDDDISEAIFETIGRKKMYYYGKHYSNSGEVAWYEYMVHDYEDEDVLTDMIKAVNAVVKEKEISEKICLAIREKIPGGGGTEGVVSLSNYYETENGYEKYESLQNLYIHGTEDSIKGNASPYNKAAIYINIPDIKRLVVEKKIAKTAEEEGIDWYEIWPDLEYYEVLEN